MIEIAVKEFDNSIADKEISAIFREYLKINNVKGSVRTHKYSMGSTIYVDLKDDNLSDDEIKEIMAFCRKYEDTAGCFPNRNVRVTVNGSQLRGKR